MGSVRGTLRAPQWATALLVLAGCPLATASSAEQAPRGLSVPDLIGLTRFGSYASGGWGADDGVVSPDGVHTALVVQRGVLRDNTREFSVLVFSNSDSGASSRGALVARFTNLSNRPAISQIKWLSNETIGFLAEGMDGHAQIYTTDLQSRAPIQRSHAALPIVMFDPVSDSIFAYATQPPAVQPDPQVLRAHGFVVAPRLAVSDVVAGDWRKVGAPQRSHPELHVVREGQDKVIPLPDESTYGECDDSLDGEVAALNFALSPSGDWALITCKPVVRPGQWSAYGEESFRKREAEGLQHAWWILIDLQSGVARPLTGGPRLNYQEAPLWSADSRSVILVNDLASLNGARENERTTVSSQRLTAEVDVRTGATTIVTTED